MNKMARMCMVMPLVLSISLFAANKEEDAFRKRVAEFQDAWNKRDAKAIAGFWAEDGDLINPMGIAAKGRMEVEKVVAGDLENVIRDGKSTFTITQIRFLKPDVVVCDMTHEISGAHDPHGSEMPSMKVLVTGVGIKKGGTWWWVAARPMIPFTPPPPPPASEPASSPKQ